MEGILWASACAREGWGCNAAMLHIVGPISHSSPCSNTCPALPPKKKPKSQDFVSLDIVDVVALLVVACIKGGLGDSPKLVARRHTLDLLGPGKETACGNPCRQKRPIVRPGVLGFRG